MNVLVLNCGSSSLKFQLVDSATETRLASSCRRTHRRAGPVHVSAAPPGLPGSSPSRSATTFACHRASDAMARQDRRRYGRRPFAVIDSAGEVHAVGHRVVTRTARASAPTPESDADVIRRIEDCMDLAPLFTFAGQPERHSGRSCSDMDAKVFRWSRCSITAFHSTMPETS